MSDLNACVGFRGNNKVEKHCSSETNLISKSFKPTDGYIIIRYMGSATPLPTFLAA